MDALVYVAFYKPYGVLTAFTDQDAELSADRQTLKSYIPLPDIYPAGRLDMDSEGLLLLTNDGELAHRLTDPRFNHPKTYLVQVEGEPTPEALAKLESGVEVKGHKTRRAQVLVVSEPELPPRAKPITPHGPTAWLRIVLREGKKRQIRHMTAAVGLPTLRLVRLAIGPVGLNELQPGQWRYLAPAEVSGLKKLVEDWPAEERRPKPAEERRPKPAEERRPKPAEERRHRPETEDQPKPETAPRAKPQARPEAKPKTKSPFKVERKPAKSSNNTRGSRYRNAGRRSPGR
jgi:23S rRNA pseudouridine2457 synthase